MIALYFVRINPPGFLPLAVPMFPRPENPLAWLICFGGFAAFIWIVLFALMRSAKYADENSPKPEPKDPGKIKGDNQDG